LTTNYPGQRSCLDEAQAFSANRSKSAVLQRLEVQPIPHGVAKKILERHHYLHTLPGGTMLCFGVFLDDRLLGAMTIGVGPKLGHRLVEGAANRDCATLTRLWLSDDLPFNSESRVIGIVLRSLARHTSLKFLLAYADPAVGHVGTIYQATNWLFTGLSQAGVMMDLGDGVPRHTRTLGYVLGTHSMRRLRSQGIEVTPIYKSRKHRYLYFLERKWRSRLRAPILPYPKGDEI
jgi:hypothetical protein